MCNLVFFFKQKTAYDMRISDWSSDVCSSDLDVPESLLPPPRIWEKESTPNFTGTALAYRPKGALEQGGQRADATGDYVAWSLDAPLGPDWRECSCLPCHSKTAAPQSSLPMGQRHTGPGTSEKRPGIPSKNK